MADEARTPIWADVKVGFEELARSGGRGVGAIRSGSSRDARRQARAARMWLYRGERSDDPEVARRVLLEHRRMEWMWQPRYDSWWFRAIFGLYSMWCAVLLVAGVADGAPVGKLVARALMMLVCLFSLVLMPRMMARRAVRTETALSEAQALLGDSSAADRGTDPPT